MTFEQWMLSVGKAKTTAQKYRSAVEGVISQWAKEAGITHTDLVNLDSLADLKDVLDPIRQLEIFIERNDVGKGMYSSALNAYVEYLDDTGEHSIADDIDQILSDPAILETERKTFISARVGQGQFRDDLYQYWGRCAVTSHSQKRLLIASHIKPWSASTNNERLDKFNGLLLIPNVDKAFDLGYITFEENGCIIISSELEEPAVLGINKKMSVTLADPHQEYMGYHREREFKS